ncbi:MAG: DEAD/DEAH box helicase, partial [Bacteroidota bacterium]
MADTRLRSVEGWFAEHGWEPFGFQRAAWAAYLDGESGLIHAGTGTGKTLAAFLGPVSEYQAAPSRLESKTEPLTVIWLTPLRALAADTERSLLAPVEAMGLPWRVERRTGDTSQSVRKRQRKNLPTVLITTPESLSLLLTHSWFSEQCQTLKAVVVDEWHELIGSKRGVMTELCLARLRQWRPSLKTWGLSATLGNLGEAMS